MLESNVNASRAREPKRALGSLFRTCSRSSKVYHRPIRPRDGGSLLSWSTYCSVPISGPPLARCGRQEVRLSDDLRGLWPSSWVLVRQAVRDGDQGELGDSEGTHICQKKADMGHPPSRGRTCEMWPPAWFCETKPIPFAVEKPSDSGGISPVNSSTVHP